MTTAKTTQRQPQAQGQVTTTIAIPTTKGTQTLRQPHRRATTTVVTSAQAAMTAAAATTMVGIAQAVAELREARALTPATAATAARMRLILPAARAVLARILPTPEAEILVGMTMEVGTTMEILPTPEEEILVAMTVAMKSTTGILRTPGAETLVVMTTLLTATTV